MRRWLLAVLVGGLLTSCSHGPRLADPIQTITEHPRLIYRSLDPATLLVEGCPTPDLLQEPEQKPLFISFPADRWNLMHGDTSWRVVYQQLDRTKAYALIGHAQPQEAGAALVAQRRASVAAQLLIEAGFPQKQLQLLASWGNPPDEKKRGQGVLIVQIPSDGGLWRMPQTVHHSQRRTNEGG